MARFADLTAALAIAFVTAACGFKSASNITAPTTTGGQTTGGSDAALLVGIWQSNLLPGGIPDASACGNFQFQVTSQTGSSIAGTFFGSCAGGLTISGTGNGQLNGTTVTLNISGSGTGLPGLPLCTFALTANGPIQDEGYTLPLSYAGTTCLGPVHGSEVLHRPRPAAAPPEPPPASAPAPPPPPSIPPGDAILRSATIYASARDVASWPATATITLLDFNANGVRVDFTKKTGVGRWPDVVPPGWDGPLQYTLWMVVNVNGQWATAGGVEYWYGLDRSGGPPSMFAQNWYYNPQVWGPLATHQPSVGEEVGFVVTAGDQRAKDVSPVRERSNVVIVPFPSNSGAIYQF